MRLIVAPLFLAFGVLASNTSAKLHNSIPKLKADSSKGCISGSVGRVNVESMNQLGKNFMLLIYSREKIDGRIQFARIFYVFDKPGSKGNDFTSDDEFGNVFTVCLKPGDYHITTMEVNGAGSRYWNPEPFDIPFRVDDNASIYIGSFSLFIEEARLEKTRKITALNLRLADRSSRDIPLIMASENQPSKAPVISLVDPASAYPYIVKYNEITQSKTRIAEEAEFQIGNRK